MMFGNNSEFIESRPIIHYPLMINYGSRRGGGVPRCWKHFVTGVSKALPFLLENFDNILETLNMNLLQV